ncbi:MAG: DUF4372 domain-containing protein [Bacteroidales bacterium]|nr:DUF4372 domain-containing protein [Bacteroidales bacterium]
MVKLTLFSQITSLIPRHIFSDIVKKYNGDKYSKGIDSWTHLISMVFCHPGQRGRHYRRQGHELALG